MIEINFEELKKNGFRINQLRMIYSSKFRGRNYKKNYNILKDSGDLTEEKNFVIESLIENNEMQFTYHLLYAVLTYVLLFITFVLFFKYNSFYLNISSLILSFIFYILARKKKENFVMGNIGITLAESIYNFDIKEKYNFKQF